MTKQITVNGKEIIVLSVPGDANYFQIKSNGDLEMKIGNDWLLTGIVGVWEYKILGTATADTIDFDCEKLVESKKEYGKFKMYKKYSATEQDGICDTADQSFRSLLTSHGFNFKNPLGDEPEYRDYVPAYLNDNFNKANKVDDFNKDLEAWQEAENSLVHKVVIIEKLITHDHPKED